MPWTQKQWIKELRRHGWTQATGGKHVVKMVKTGHRPITLPHHRGATYGKALDAAIRKQADL